MSAKNAFVIKANMVKRASAECCIGIGASDLPKRIPTKWFGNV
jgi:hypothetical protein